MNIEEKYKKFMLAALDEAKLAAELGEVPVGAVIVKDDKIIASAHNTRETEKNAIHHAEMLAISKACRVLGGWRLVGCEMYVTLEPCPMCAGAIVNARIPLVVYGAKDSKAGALGSVFDIFSYPLNFKSEVVSDVCAEESRELLQSFFKIRRLKNKQ